jgi:hypothetical protein
MDHKTSEHPAMLHSDSVVSSIPGFLFEKCCGLETYFEVASGFSEPPKTKAKMVFLKLVMYFLYYIVTVSVEMVPEKEELW